MSPKLYLVYQFPQSLSGVISIGLLRNNIYTLYDAPHITGTFHHYDIYGLGAR